MTASIDTPKSTATRTVTTAGNTYNNLTIKDKRKGGARPGSGRPRTRPRKAAVINKDVKKIVFQNEIVQAAVILADLSALRTGRPRAGTDASVEVDDSQQFESPLRQEYENQYLVNGRDDTDERLQLYSPTDDGNDEREPSQSQLAKRVSFESIEATELAGSDPVEKEDIVATATADDKGPKAHPPPTSSSTIISSLHPNDILIGHNDWPGTRRYHAWVDARKKGFHMSSKRSERARLAKEVTGLVQAQTPPGRFLRFIKQQGWFEIDETTVLTEVGKDFRQGITGGASLALPNRPPPPPPPQHLGHHQLIPPASFQGGPRFPAASYLPTMPQRGPFRGPPPPHMNNMAPPPHRHAKPQPQPPAFYGAHAPAGMRTPSNDGSRSHSRNLTPPAGTRGYPRAHAHMHGRPVPDNKGPRYSQYTELSRHSRRISTDSLPITETPKIMDNTTSTTKTLLKKPPVITKRSISDDHASVSSSSSSSTTASLQPSVKTEEPPTKKARRPHSFWGPKEDDELRKAVEKNGEKWSAVALDMPACSSEQCRYRWTHCLDPEINRDPLTPDEYRAILEHQAKVGNKWSKLAKELSGRTDHFIRKYWTCAIRPKVVRYLMHVRGCEAVDVIATEGRGFDYQGNELEGALHFLLAEIEFDKMKIITLPTSTQGVAA